MTRGRAPRNWKAAMRKRDAGGCRIDNDECFGAVQAAHVIGRSYDDFDEKGRRVVNENSIVGLCLYHHAEYDARRFSLLEYLTPEEQADAVLRVGLVRALKRVGGVEPPSEEVPK